MLKAKLFILPAVALLFLCSCTKSEKEIPPTDKKEVQETKMIPKSDSAAMKNAKYVCPMHPLERSGEPGRCPVCKMKLVAMQDLNKEMSDQHEALEKNFADKKNAVHYELKIPLMKSEDCGAFVETALRKDPGVIGLHIDILNNVVHLYFDKLKTTKKDIEHRLNEAASNLPSGCK